MNIWMEALINLKQAEKTRLLWDNPLSIYKPDPVKLSAVMFNADREEHLREVKKVLEDLKLKVLQAKGDTQNVGAYDTSQVKK